MIQCSSILHHVTTSSPSHLCFAAGSLVLFVQTDLKLTVWPSLVPRPLPDYISQLWRKLGQKNNTAEFLHICEIKSGSGLGMRLSMTKIIKSLQYLTPPPSSPPHHGRQRHVSFCNPGGCRETRGSLNSCTGRRVWNCPAQWGDQLGLPVPRRNGPGSLWPGIQGCLLMLSL